MTDIAAGDVTVTVNKRTIGDGGLRNNFVTIAFGNATLTYPSGGVPLSAAKLGLSTALQDLVITDGSAGTGIVWKYDTTNKKLRGYEGDYAQTGDANLVELDSGSDAPAAQTLHAIAIGY